jgi:hypothetical protein
MLPSFPTLLSGSVVGVGGKAGFSAIRYPALMAHPLSVSQVFRKFEDSCISVSYRTYHVAMIACEGDLFGFCQHFLRLL